MYARKWPLPFCILCGWDDILTKEFKQKAGTFTTIDRLPRDFRRIFVKIYELSENKNFGFSLYDEYLCHLVYHNYLNIRFFLQERSKISAKLDDSIYCAKVRSYLLLFNAIILYMLQLLTFTQRVFNSGLKNRIYRSEPEMNLDKTLEESIFGNRLNSSSFFGKNLVKLQDELRALCSVVFMHRRRILCVRSLSVSFLSRKSFVSS